MNNTNVNLQKGFNLTINITHKCFMFKVIIHTFLLKNNKKIFSTHLSGVRN